MEGLIYILIGLFAISVVSNIIGTIIDKKQVINKVTPTDDYIVKEDGIYYKSGITGAEFKIGNLNDSRIPNELAKQKESIHYLNKDLTNIKRRLDVNNRSNKEIEILIKQMRSSQETYWVQLLEKYIQHVNWCESSTFISKANHNDSPVKFTKEELFSLNALNIE